MALFEDMQCTVNCPFISDFHSLFRKKPKEFLNSLIFLSYRHTNLAEWKDMLNYLQIPFKEDELTDMKAVRKILDNYC